MTIPSPRPISIPRWPRTTAVLNDDGTGELTINGITHPVAASDVEEARALVRERVSAHAHDELGRPVRLLTTDPDGWWELAVYPDGHVCEIAALPAVAKPTTPPKRLPHPPRGATSSASSAPAPDRRRIAQRVVACLALLSVIASAAAVALSTSDDAPAPALPRPPAVDEGNVSASLADARRDAAHRAELRKARRERAAKRRAAHEKAIAQKQAIAHERGVAHEQAIARKQDRAAKRRAAARRARDRRAADKRPTSRSAASSSHERGASDPKPTASAKPRPAAPPPPPPPPPPAAQPCGQFDLC